jgi:hypothetical protein
MAPVTYKLPDQMTNPRYRTFLRAQRLVEKFRFDSRSKLAVGFHEAGHKLEFDRLGVESKYEGLGIEHDNESDSFSVVYGKCIPICEDGVLHVTAEQLARVAVAGRVTELVMLGEAPVETSEFDFLGFIHSGLGKPSELIYLWKTTEESMIQELRSDLAWQQKAVHEASRFERAVFGPDRSIKRTL